MPATSSDLGRRREARDRATDRLLQRVLIVEIAVAREPALDAVGEHPAVLARAVVRERRVRRRRRHFAAHLEKPRSVRSAAKIAGRVARAGEHVGHRVDMPRLARMARAKERDLRLRIAEALGTARCDEGHRLERLQRAARHRHERRVARRGEQPAVAIDDRDRSVVNALHGDAARESRERNVGTAGDAGDAGVRGGVSAMGRSSMGYRATNGRLSPITYRPGRRPDAASASRTPTPA